MTFSNGDDAAFVQGGASGADGPGEGREARDGAGEYGEGAALKGRDALDGSGSGGDGAAGSPASAPPEGGAEAAGDAETDRGADGDAAGAEAAGAAEERPERPNFLTPTRFYDLDLPPKILEGLDEAGFLYATPIQAKVIPEALKGKDIAGQAQTGTGKTVAFLVPMMARLMTRPPARPGLTRAIVVTPTRELAEQIHSDGRKLSTYTGLTQALVIGGMDYREQARALEAGPDIVVGTPGRLTDYIHKRIFNTQGVEVSVVDEADRLLDLGFIRDLKFILSRLPSYEERQTMLFSATLSHQILELVYQFMNPPQYITAEPGPQSRVQTVQELYHVSRAEKLPLLLGLLKREEHSRVLVFCNTRSGVDWLAKKLVGNGYHAEGITGDLPQPKRLRLMQAFKDNQLDIMVATDVASRGIHVEDVSHVFNYDLPQDAEDYVHRIGRTARAGKTGKAVSFACEEYVHHLEAIENILGEKIPVAFADDDLFLPDRSADVRRKATRPPARRGEGGHGRGDGRGDGAGDSRPAAASGAGGASASGGDGASRAAPGGGASGPPPSGGGGHGGRNGHDDGGFASRGLAFSDRPGGVFGLAPRLPVTNDRPDVRFELPWSPQDIVSRPEELPVAGVASGAEARGGPEDRGRAYESDLESDREFFRGGYEREGDRQGAPAGAEPGETTPAERRPGEEGGAPDRGYQAAAQEPSRDAPEDAPQPAQGAQGDQPAGDQDGEGRREGRRRRRHRSRHRGEAREAEGGAPAEGAQEGAEARRGEPAPEDAAACGAQSAWSPSPHRSYVIFRPEETKDGIVPHSVRDEIGATIP
ncbi:MAG: DEAD/DEAH box helicase, partial [Deltaproteobacteria bacterium]|nr:DEAD/DEAH box helicase [Deltaproteobacteria bacterium]